jgi:hypothetical protein
MALSQTSLEIDTLTVETLFNRGPLLSTTQAYVPVMSNIGGFSKWINQPVSTMYYPFFRSYPEPDVLLVPANTILQTSQRLSTSLHYNTDVLSTFENINYSTLVVLSNIDSSTVSTYRSTFSNDNTIALDRNRIIADKLSEDLSGLLLTSTMFRTDNFSYNASSLITVASNYYAKGKSRYIGPGLSSMYDYTLNEDSNRLLNRYRHILDTSSNDSSNLSKGFLERRRPLTNAVDTLAGKLETGSSFSTLYSDSNSSFLAFVSSLSSPEFFFDTYINSFSTLVYTGFNEYTIPTQGPFISSALSSLTIQNSTLFSSLLSSITPSTLSIPLLVFSSLIGFRVQSNVNVFNRYNYIPGFSTINFRFSTILNPIVDPLSVSTNLYGYQYISTTKPIIISSLSTIIPGLIAGPRLSSLRLLNSTVSSILSSVNFNTSTIIGMAYPYVTAPGISSFSTMFASQIEGAKTNYADRISSVLIPFYVNLSNVNSIPGLSSLAKAGSNVGISLSNQIPIITRFVNIDYPSYEIGFLSSYNLNYTNLSTAIDANTKKYIEMGVAQYSSLYFNYISLSTGVGDSITNINIFAQKPGGLAFNSIEQLYPLVDNTYTIFSNVESSNSYFTPLRIIPDYSTSIYSFPPGVIPKDGDQYLLRSTFFRTVQANTIIYDTANFNISTLCVGTSSSSYKFEVDGGTRITPYSIDTNYFLIGNNIPRIYSQADGPLLLNDPYDIDQYYYHYLNYAFGTAIFENSMIVTGYNSETGNYRSQVIPLNKSEISTFEYFDNTETFVFNSPISSSSEFYTLPNGYPAATGNVIQGFDPTIGNIQSFYRAPYYFHFQIPFQFPLPEQRLNYVMYTSNILSNNYNFLNFPAVDTYLSLGPITSFTTNGSYYLLTATSNTYSNYYENIWNPVSTDIYYTLFVTSNIDFLNLQNEQFSTPMISNPPVELHDGLWTGKNWLVAGDGVYTSPDAFSWNQVLPTSSERLLHYRSMDFNGEDIMLAHVSSSPRYIEFLKSSDYGNTWAKTSTIALPSLETSYSDISIKSSVVYSVNLKWAFSKWSAYVNSFDSSYSHIFTSSNGGTTWSGSEINNEYSIPDRDTANVLFQPIENIKPSIELPNFHIYARDDPVRNPTANTLSVRFSSIIFNEGDFTIKRRYNSLLRGVMGINTIYPTYSLDIAIGDARKPSGTLWINPSDRRIKTNIIEADSDKIVNELSSVRLVQYKWKELYRDIHHLSAEPTIGFISQEIESIYPSSIYYSEEAGFTDFRTLDTDQLFKAKFRLTQHLLKRASTLQSRIDTLLRASI